MRIGKSGFSINNYHCFLTQSTNSFRLTSVSFYSSCFFVVTSFLIDSFAVALASSFLEVVCKDVNDEIWMQELNTMKILVL